MKTLITLNNPELIQLIFKGEALERLKSFSEVDWLDDYSALESCISKNDACISSWGSPKFTDKILEKADKLQFIGHAAGVASSMAIDDNVEIGKVDIHKLQDILADQNVMIHFDDSLVPGEEAEDVFAGAQGHL